MSRIEFIEMSFSEERIMRIRKTVAISILVLLGLACGGSVVAVYTDYSVRASALSLPDALNNIPSNYQFVFGLNVANLARSTVYSKLQRNGAFLGDFASITERTGLDFMRDIRYVVGAGRSNPNSPNEGVAIAVGKFNKEAITSYIRSKSSLVEKEYGGASILMIPDQKSDEIKSGIAFLDEQEIALGDLQSLKAVLDTRGKAGKSILSNTALASLIEDVSSESTLWFAGDSSGVLTSVPAMPGLPFGNGTMAIPNLPSIRNFSGRINITDAVAGKITATALDAAAAAKLADAMKGLIALAQLTGGNKQPELKMLLGGLTISQESTQVFVALNFPGEVLNQLGKTSPLPRKSVVQ